MAKPTLVSFDVGSASIHAVAAQFNPDTQKVEILSTLTRNSQGIRKGVIVDLEEAKQAIGETRLALQNSAGFAINSAHVSLSGSHIAAKPSQGVVAISRADGEVSEEDVDRVIEAAKTFSLPQNRQIIHTVPREYTVDKETGIENPIGMTGVRLEVSALIIEAFSPYIKNLERAFESNSLGIESLLFTPIAAAEAVLTKRQKELGVVLIDIGASTTSVAVYEEGTLLHAATLPAGAAHITNDLAIGFKIPVEIAEEIKTKFGTCFLEDVKKKDTINLSKFGLDEAHISRYEAAQIIEARMSEILGLINRELGTIDRKKLLPAGAIFVGGGAKLNGIIKSAKKCLGLPAQIGYPTNIGGLVEEVNDPEFATCVGLLTHSLMFGSPRTKGSSVNIDKASSKVLGWFRHLIP